MKISEIEKKIDVKHIDRPEEIYNIFSNIDDHWGRIHRSWIFRGQRSSEWDLLPSLFRIDIAEKWILQKKDEEIDYIEFCKREFKIIGNFTKLSDSAGLKVPTDSYEFRTRDIKKGDNFPPKQNIEIWAIAQHHGIPTRLLDFSHNGLYAIYFAALDAYIKKDYNGELAVWAININKYYELFAKSIRKLQVVSVPTHDNNYLFSQKGLFLLENKLSHRWSAKRRFSEINFCIFNVLQEECDEREKKLKEIVELLCYPKAKIIELLEILHKNEINLSSLKPNYDSIKMTMELEKELNFKRM